MRLIAGLIWFKESPTWLAAMAASLEKLGVDHLVALDGAFVVYNGIDTSGGLAESQSIAAVCDALDIGYTIHRPNIRYGGNEPQKRDMLFKMMLAQATADDWSFIIDADEVVRSVEQVYDIATNTTMTIKQALAATDLDVAHCTRIEKQDQHDSEMNSMISRTFETEEYESISTRRFFRLLPDIRVVSNHHTYLAGQGEDEKVLWSAGIDPNDVESLDLGMCVVIEHRQALRDRSRHIEKWDYYARRDRLGVEVPYKSKEKQRWR